MIFLLAVFAYVLVSAPDAYAADPSECRTVKSVKSGDLCTIRPSDTDPMIQDEGSTKYGFGDHVVALPDDPNGKVWVHFAGTGGKPYLPQQRRYLNEVWLNELMGEGYTMIDLAYDSEFSINEACQGDGASIDDCAGAARLEVSTGVDASPLRSVSVADSIVHRLVALVDFMHRNEMPLPEGAFPFDWNHVSVSGHSQGAGHAYYAAKYYGVEFTCFLGGPYDVPDSVPKKRPPAQFIADWYLDNSSNATSVSDMGAFLAMQDDFYTEFVFAYGVIGLDDFVVADKGRYTDSTGKVINGHAAAVQDPSLAKLRARACF